MKSTSKSTNSSGTDLDNETAAAINVKFTSDNGKDGPQPVKRKKRDCPKPSSSWQEWKDDPKAPSHELAFASKRCINVVSNSPLHTIVSTDGNIGERLYHRNNLTDQPSCCCLL